MHEYLGWYNRNQLKTIENSAYIIGHTNKHLYNWIEQNYAYL